MSGLNVRSYPDTDDFRPPVDPDTNDPLQMYEYCKGYMDLSTRKWQYMQGQYDGLNKKYESYQSELDGLMALKKWEIECIYLDDWEDFHEEVEFYVEKLIEYGAELNWIQGEIQVEMRLENEWHQQMYYWLCQQ